jgi:predicted XRE-type DNA-binding protein
LPSPASENYTDDDLKIGSPIYNVFYAIEEDPREAARQTMMAELWIVLTQHIKAQGWTQKEAATRLGVTQPRISDLMRGKLHLFSIDSLIAMLGSARIEFRLEVLTYPDAA